MSAEKAPSQPAHGSGREPRIGYTLMTEQSGPKELVSYAVAAERCGFDFEVSSDHYFPWLSAQGHAPYAWTLLGAVAQATERVELMTCVTSPTRRYHPAVVAQKAATLQILADGRFVLGLGSGENLNEHVVGQGGPPVAQRQDMFSEAVTIIRELHAGGLVTFDGTHFRVDSARIWDLPDDGVPIALAVSGAHSIARFAPLGDHLITTEPDHELISGWQQARRDAGNSEPAEPLGRCRFAGTRTAMRPSVGRISSSAGMDWVGRSTPTYRPLQDLRRPHSSFTARTSPSRSRAVRTSTPLSRPSNPTGRRPSPTWPSFRLVTRARMPSWPRLPGRCWTSCDPLHSSDRDERGRPACAPRRAKTAV